jgi:dTDP-4-dehydrorhamnose 3,5-epimerase
MIGTTTPHIDTRGRFARLFCGRTFEEVLGQRSIVQINHSHTSIEGTVRGLHFQYPPHSELKIVHCLSGRIWDVAVDLRYNSPTFLQWFAQELTPANGRMMIIPEGFAHGFQVLEANSELLYLHTAFYNPEAEGGLRYSDPKLKISWPLYVTDTSPRDATHPLIDSNFKGLAL